MKSNVLFCVLLCSVLAMANGSASAQSLGISTVAGSAGLGGSTDGTNSLARFSQPNGIVALTNGTLFIADTGNHVIRKAVPSSAGWVVTTIAGKAGSSGTTDASNSVARFYFPYGITADVAGNLYVADTYNHAIRKLTLYGTNWGVTTLAGLAGSSGVNDGTGTAARFNQPSSLALDANGNLIVADTYNSSIRQVTPGGVVTSLAGSNGVPGIADGPGTNARFNHPSGVVTFGTNIFVADTFNHTIRKLSFVGGAWTSSTIAGIAGVYGSDDGTNRFAFFDFPWGLVADPASNLYIADNVNQTIRRLSPQGTNWISATLAGQVGIAGGQDGVAQAAQFNSPRGLALSASGDLFVTDGLNNTVRTGRFGFALNSVRLGSQLILSWPTQAATYSLQGGPSVAPGTVWTNVTTGIFTAGTNFVRTNVIGSGPAFFRLKKN